MALRCNECGTTDIELVDDNGANFPQTRVEFFKCNGCGNQFRNILEA